ncbi:MAG: OmpA family protein [Nitrospirae bacterium]|nr:OmpA family protein [Nitrospirota bacterium]
MKTMQFLITVTLVVLFTGCAAKVPGELINARAAYQSASEGPAAQLAPVELHNAYEALSRAEQSFKKEPRSDKTKDLSYVAQRKAELAGAIGATAVDKAKKDKADADFQKQQAELVKQGKQDLSDAEKRQAETLAAIAAEQASKDKAAVEKRQAETLAAMAAEQANKDKANAELVKQGKQDLSDSEKRTAVAMAELAKLAAVREEERGLVVTLSGSVLFRSNESNLMSSAQVKLDQVAKALMAVRTRNLIVEGHTDSQGSESYNQGLSQRRAEAVRDYLAQKGYPAERIQARGKGKGSPIADNASPEGRANNRRVEIVIERESQKPNP